MPGRLLLVLVAPARGGAEDYALTIGRAALAQGWSVHALLPFARGTETLRQDLHAAGIAPSPLSHMQHVVRDSEPSIRSTLRAAASFAQVAGRFRPDVVHVTLPWPTFAFPFLVTSALLALPTLVVFQLVPAGLFVPRRRRLMYAWMRGRTQRWIAVSEHGRRLIASLYRMDAATIGVIRNGAAPPVTNSGDPECVAQRTSLRAELGLSTNATLLLSVGRLHAQKGQAELICAVAGVYAERRDVRLIIAGNGPERERLEHLILALGLEEVVQLLGHRADTGRLMDAADLFVFPSHFEGTPFAMLEAMSHGLPIVAAAFGGVEEILEDERTGVLVPVARPDALRAAIVGVLADRERMRHLAAAGRKRAAVFGEDAMVAATLHELERLRAP